MTRAEGEEGERGSAQGKEWGLEGSTSEEGIGRNMKRQGSVEESLRRGKEKQQEQ